jgi:uncharacterized DUF497 family protein
MRFEWDPIKARINLRKHGVSFPEAATVFGDPLATYYEDPDHSTSERRYLTIGSSIQGRLLHIAFADHGEHIRIIQARKLTRNETTQYEEESR